MRDQSFAPFAQHIAGGNANAASQANGLTKTVYAHFGNALKNALRQWMSRLRVGAAEQHHKLFAAVAANDIGLTQLGVNGWNNRFETGIASKMTEGVVDLLEVIKV